MSQSTPSARRLRAVSVFASSSLRYHLPLLATCLLIVAAPSAAWAQLVVHPENGVAQQDVCDLGPNGVLDPTGQFGDGGDDVLCDGTGPGRSDRSDGADWAANDEPRANQGKIDASGVSIATNDHVAVQVFSHGFAVLDLNSGAFTRRLLSSLLADLGRSTNAWTGIPDIIWEPNGRRFIMLFNTPAKGYPLLLVSKTENPTINEGDWYVVDLYNVGQQHAAFRLAAWPGVLLLTADHLDTGENYLGSSVFALELGALESGSPATLAACIDCANKPWLATSISRPTEAAVGTPAYLVTGRHEFIDLTQCPTFPICVGGQDDLQFGIQVFRATPDFSTGLVYVSPPDVVVNRNNFDEKQPGAVSRLNYVLTLPRNLVPVVPQLDQVVFQNNAWTPYIAPVFLKTAAGVPRSAVFSNLTDRLAPSEWRPTIWTTRETELDDGSVAVIWEQIDVSDATPALLQWGLEGGGNSHRWMPSLGVDKLGNMALGMSMSEPQLSSGNFVGPLPRYPKFAINMRQRTDAPDQLKFSNTWQEDCPYAAAITGLDACSFQGQGNTPDAIEGGGGRWGGNSAMALRPNGCSFIYSNQLITAEGGIGGNIFTYTPPSWAQWRTRIAAVALDPLCYETTKPSIEQTDSDGIDEPQPNTLYLIAQDETSGSGLAGPPYCVIEGERVSATLASTLGGNDIYRIGVPDNNWVDCTAVDRAENETTASFRAAADDPPQVSAFSVTTDEDTAVSINFAAHVSDDLTPVQSLIYSVITGPSKGSTFGAGSSTSYTPNLNVSGSDSITYQACDESGQCASAVVSIQINPVDDAPVAKSDSASLTEDAAATMIDVLTNDTDVDGGPKAIASVGAAGHGSVTNNGSSVSYQPAANYCNDGAAPDQFTYTLTPGSSTTTVSVTVACVDDVPLAMDDSASLTEDAPATMIYVLTNDVDIDGGPRAVAAVGPASHGTVTNGTSYVSYQPAANYCNDGEAPDQFTYTLTPGGTTATVSVTVACVNDIPQVSIDGTAQLDEGQTGSYAFSTVDPDAGDSFTLIARSCGSGGVVANLSFSMITGAGSFDCLFADGPATPNVTVQVADAAGAQSNTGAKLVSVSNVAPQPKIDAVAGGLAFIPVNTWFDLEASFTDPGDDSFTADVDWDNDGTFDDDLGAVNRSGLVASHAYAAGGTYTIVLRVADEDGDSGTATITIEVLDLEAGSQRLADDLGARLGSDPAKDPALQSAISALIGNGDGDASNGAQDKLASGDRVAALFKLLDAQVALAQVGDAEATEAMILIAQIARVVMDGSVTDARDATGCQLPLAKSCSKGERKAFDKILAYANAGDLAYAGGDYVAAVAQFAEAVKLADALL